MVSEAVLSDPTLDATASDERLHPVDRFARAHDASQFSARSRQYRTLLPFAKPEAGQQYRFEVDLEACSGCKACVAACHQLNGLDDDEAWRDVGLLIGGSTELPVLQHVTTSCHHCLDPACLNGCPVKAYEKDPITGIVAHLDDQCIGCQYCMLMCPYEAPKYNRQRGIVRKCDMCSDRLAVGEPPACVQACPNDAIRIGLVSNRQVVEDSESNSFLPGAEPSSTTLPTTIYHSSTPLPRNTLPAEQYSTTPNHAHLPLAIMLVLTQMSVGTFGVGLITEWLSPTAAGGTMVIAAGALIGVLSLAVSFFHLGRPFYAFRSIVGLRTSWLSREILAFGLYVVGAMTSAAMCLMGRGDSDFWLFASLGVLLIGVAGVLSSVMVYHVTKRPFWTGLITGPRFLLTTGVLGLSTTLAVSIIHPAINAGGQDVALGAIAYRPLCAGLLVSALAKLLIEAGLLTHLKDRRYTSLRRSAALMAGPLVGVTLKRFIFGTMGGVVVPLFVMFSALVTTGGEPDLAFLAVLGLLAVVMTLIGELMERYLFFVAVVAPKMPGGVG